MHLIIYISEYTGFDTSVEGDLRDICRLSQKNNPEHGITGVLMYRNHHFLQAIEGEQAELESLMRNLEEDFRHRGIERLFDEPIPEQSFYGWNMDTFHLCDGLVMDPRTLRKYKELYTQRYEVSAFDFVARLKRLCSDPEMASLKLELSR